MFIKKFLYYMMLCIFGSITITANAQYTPSSFRSQKISLQSIENIIDQVINPRHGTNNTYDPNYKNEQVISINKCHPEIQNLYYYYKNEIYEGTFDWERKHGTNPQQWKSLEVKFEEFGRQSFGHMELVIFAEKNPNRVSYTSIGTYEIPYYSSYFEGIPSIFQIQLWQCLVKNSLRLSTAVSNLTSNSLQSPISTSRAKKAPSTASAAPPTKLAPPAAVGHVAAAKNQRLLRTHDAINAIDNMLMASPNLTDKQKSLQSIWSINASKTMLDQVTPGSLSPAQLEQRSQLRRYQEGRVGGCSGAVDAAERQTCLNGAFFGTSEQFAVIQREANVKPSQTPKLKRVPVDPLTRCLTLETAGLYGGFINSCDQDVMVVWCIENPSKESWGESFRCVEGKDNMGLDIVKARSSSMAHTRGGNVVMFGCGWRRGGYGQAGPDGIWTALGRLYKEGVGTPGVIRGTCGEQVYVPR